MVFPLRLANSRQRVRIHESRQRRSQRKGRVGDILVRRIIGLVLMFVAAVWRFFDSGPYEAWLDVVVTGLFVIAIAIPTLLWLTWRRNADSARDASHLSFRDWAVGDFNTLTGPVKGANATAEVLLPIAAVAVGMTVLGLVFHIIANGAA
jgi:hypothetical protein